MVRFKFKEETQSQILKDKPRQSDENPSCSIHQLQTEMIPPNCLADVKVDE